MIFSTVVAGLSIGAGLLVNCADAVPVIAKRTSSPFGLVAVRPDEPMIDGKFVSVRSDGTLWVNAGSLAFLGVIHNNSTLQQLGTAGFLRVDDEGAIILGEPGSAEKNFKVNEKSLEYKGDSQAIACRKYQDEYQLYFQVKRMHCKDLDGEPSDSIYCNLKTVAIEKPKPFNNTPPIEREEDNQVNATASTAGNSTNAKRDLSMILPLPVDANLTVSLVPGPGLTGGVNFTAGSTPTNAALSGETTRAIASASASTARVTAAVVSIDAAQGAARAAQRVTETSPVADTKQAKETAPPAEFSDETHDSPSHPAADPMDHGPKDNSDDTSTDEDDDQDDDNDQDFEDDGGPDPDKNEVGRISPELFTVKQDMPDLPGKSQNAGQVQTKNGTHEELTLAKFMIPINATNHGSCYLEFETRHPMIKPQLDGDRSFEVWTADRPIVHNVTYNSMPQPSKKLGEFAQGQFRGLSVAVDCSAGSEIGMVLKPGAAIAHTYVRWWQHRHSGLKLVLSSLRHDPPGVNNTLTN